MNIRLNLSLMNYNCNHKIPLKHSISSFIYSLMGRDVSNSMHDIKGKTKHFTFSNINFGKCKFVGNNTIFVSNDIATLDISSSDKSIIDAIISNIDKSYLYNIDNVFFTISNYYIDNIKIPSNHKFFRVECIEPILLTKKVDGKSKFVSFDDNDYTNQLITNINNKCNTKLSDKDIEITYNKKKYISYKKDANKLSYYLKFNIRIDSSSMELLINDGIGMLNSGGFGKIKVIKSCQ